MHLAFLSGLPRSGSALLMNLLLQNPRFQGVVGELGHTSGLQDVLFEVRKTWCSLVPHRAHPQDSVQWDVLKAVAESYHARHRAAGCSVLVDRCRGWEACLEWLEPLLNRKAQIILCVRSIPEVLASFELLYRRARADGWTTDDERNHFWNNQTIFGRCQTLMSSSGPVGMALNRIIDALDRGYEDRLHFVHYDDLCARPMDVLDEVYEFLSEQAFRGHDFEQVTQQTFEDDRVHNYPGLHSVRPAVEFTPHRAKAVIGKKLTDMYAALDGRRFS
jgi:sulfotransferase